jgi:hypothetical protein
MHRLFLFLALTAAGLGIAVLFLGPDAGATSVGVLQNAPLGYGGWAIGLLMGLALAWLSSIDWSGLPGRVGDWVRLQRRRLWLAMLGGLFAGVLLFF